MRLWHEELLPHLPRHQILGQNRECAALRGKGWGKRHSTVDYVFTHSIEDLVRYHFKVIKEMHRRKYNVNELWFDSRYRGKKLGYDYDVEYFSLKDDTQNWSYPEHNEEYLQECLENLKQKGISIEV